MNPFAEKFQYYLKEKGMKIGDVHRFSGLNLTTLYKLQDGTREPTKLEAVEKIADSLCLNRDEREELVESFYLTRLGPLGYYGRKEVRNFYRNLNLEPVEETRPFLPFKDISLKPGESMVLKGKQNVDIALEYFIYKAAEENPGTTVKITEYLQDSLILSIAANVSSVYPKTQFMHTLRLDEISSENVEKEGMFYNVHVLSQVLTFAARHNNYKVFYRYTDVEMEQTQLSHLNCTILAGEYVIQYSPDHRYCIVERDRNISRLFAKIDGEEKDTVNRLIYQWQDAENENNREAYRLFREPVIGASGYLYYSGLLMSELEKPDLGEPQKFMKRLLHSIPTIVLPKYLIEDFAEDSTAGSTQDRVKALEKLLDSSHSKKIGITGGARESFPAHFFSAITLSTLYIGIPSKGESPILLALNEPTIVHAFYDFIDSLYRQGSYSQAESVQFIEQKIEELKAREPEV